MKKTLCLLLTLAMILGLLAACGDTKDPEPNPAPDDSSTVVDGTETPDDSTEPVTDNTEVEEPDTTKAASLNDRLAYIIDDSRDIAYTESFPVETTNENGVLTLMELTEEDVTEYAVTYSPMNVHAYIIAILKPAEGKDDVVMAALENYKQNMVNSFEQYLPDQYEIAQNAEIFATEGYMGIVMSEESANEIQIIKDWLEDIDTIEIDESLAVDNNVDEPTISGNELEIDFSNVGAVPSVDGVEATDNPTVASNVTQ